MDKNNTSDQIKIPFTDKLIYDSTLKLCKENFELDLKNTLKNQRPWKSKIEELKNVAPFISTHEFAIFASRTYTDRKKGELEKDFEEKMQLPDGWKILTTAVDNSWFSLVNGYVGIAFWKPDQRQIVIAHRGTVPTNIGAIFTDIKGIYGENYVRQMNSACTFAHKVYAAVESVDDVSKWQIFFTGHSLGAWLAQITTFSLKYLKLGRTKFLRNPKFGYHAHTEVFDSPGCQEMLSRMARDFDVRHHGKVVDINTLDITSYLSSPNMVNCCNSHVGTLLRIYPETPSDKPAIYTNSSHSMDGIVSFFEQSAEGFGGIKMKRVVDWPKLQASFSILQLCSPLADTTLGEEYDDFFIWANKLNDFDPEEENVTFDKNIADIENLVPKLYTPIRYQVTEAVRKISFRKTVFNELELETLQAFQWLLKVPEFFKPETIFEHLTKEDNEEIVNISGQLCLQEDSVTCAEGSNLRKLIPFAKTLIKIFPELITKTKSALNSLEARKQIYFNTTADYLSKLESTVSMFRPSECPSLFSFVRDNYVKMAIIESDHCTDLVMARAVKFLEPFWNSFENHFAMEIQILITVDKSFKFEKILTSKELGKTLVLLECKDNALESRQHKTLVKLIDILTRINSVKILLVTRNGKDRSQIEFYSRFKLNEGFLKISYYGLKWADLNEHGRKILLSSKVVRFQCQTEKVSLIDVIGNDSSEVGDLFDSLTLTKLIKNETIKIGSKHENLKEVENYYIPRMFEYEKQINPKGVKQEGAKGLLSEDAFLYQLSEGKIVIISDAAGMGKSTVLTSLALKLKQLLPHIWIVRVNLNDCTLALAKILAENKPTYFTKKDPSLAVKFLLEKVLFNNDGTKPKELETKLLEHNLLNRSSCVALFFDAFDEISPNYDKIVTQLLVSLSCSRVRNIFVTTRPHTGAGLEENLETTAIKMVPLEEEDQNKFLTRFWESSATIAGGQKFIVKGDKRQFALDCIKTLAVSMFDGENDIMGIPLQCRLLAEYIMLNSSDAEATKNAGISLINLYESFVQSKFSIYHREKGLDVKGNPSATNKNIFIESPLRRLHQKIALQLIMGKNQKLLNDEEVRALQPEIIRVGIVTGMGENPLFVHRTFAEYFVVDYLLAFSDSANSTALTNEILLKNEYRVLRIFLNSVIKSGQRRSESFAIFRYYVNDVVSKWKINKAYYVNEQGETALMVAFKEKLKFVFTLFMELLLEKKGSNVTISYIYAKCLMNVTALHHACKSGSENCVKGLVENRPDEKFFQWPRRNILNDKTRHGLTPLQLACREGHVKIALYLIAKGAGVNASNMIGQTPLHIAVQNGSQKIVASLISNGSKIDALDHNDQTPLQMAIEFYEKDIALFLIANGSNVNREIRISEYSDTSFLRVETCRLLHYATRRDWCDVVTELIEKGAEIDMTDGNHRTSLHVAIAYFSSDTVNFLIKKGASVNAVDKFGDSSLHISASSHVYDTKDIELSRRDYRPLRIRIVFENYKKMSAVFPLAYEAKLVVRLFYNFNPLSQFCLKSSRLLKNILPLLREKGLDINARNIFGETPLYKAARAGLLDNVKLLVENGAEINTFTNEKGLHVKYTPLHIATLLYHVQVARFLLRNGADREACNEQNQNPLSLALEKGYVEMIDLLSNHKSSSN